MPVLFKRHAPKALALALAIITLTLFNSTEETVHNMLGDVKKVVRAPGPFFSRLRDPNAGNDNFPGISFEIRDTIRSEALYHYRLSGKLRAEEWTRAITAVLVWPVKTEERSRNVFVYSGEPAPDACTLSKKGDGVDLVRCD